MALPNGRSRRRLTIVAVLAGALAAGCGSGTSHSSGPTTTQRAGPATTATSATTAAPSTTATTAAPPTTTTTAAPPATAAPPTTAAPATTATTVVTTSGAGCYAGNWTSTNYSQQVQGQHIAGGAGIHFDIAPGEMSINFTGMQPVTVAGTVSGQGIYLGQEQAAATFSFSGTFALPVKGTGNVTFEAKFGAEANYSPPIQAGGFPTGGITGRYTCSGSTLTLTVPTPQGPTTVTLARS